MSSVSPDVAAFEEGTIGWALLQSDVWNHIIPGVRKLPKGLQTESLPARGCSSAAGDYLGDSIGFIATTRCPKGKYDLCLSLRMGEEPTGPDGAEDRRSKAVQKVRASVLAGNASDTVFSTRGGANLSAFLIDALSRDTLNTRLEDLSKLEDPKVIERGDGKGIRLCTQISTDDIDEPEELHTLQQPVTFQISYGLPERE